MLDPRDRREPPRRNCLAPTRCCKLDLFMRLIGCRRQLFPARCGLASLLVVLCSLWAIVDAQTMPAAPTAAPTLNAGSTVFQYTGTLQQYIIPSGAIALHVKLVGASGGDASAQHKGGLGAAVEVQMTIPAGTPYVVVVVGGKGSPGVTGDWGGYNGGGASTYEESASGGGATDIRISTASTPPLTSRKVVAGGGGGGDSYCEVTAVTGNAGYPTGAAGSKGTCSSYTAATGGTQSAGGSGSATLVYSANNGFLGGGGVGCSAGGAGGGGGYYGGGGACGGTGGGGSSYSAYENAVYTSAYNYGNGYAIITPVFPDPSAIPTHNPSVPPSASPSTKPSTAPSAKPTTKPSTSPTAMPSVKPSPAPSAKPSPMPTASPTSGKPTLSPTEIPSAEPTSGKPTSSPTVKPSTAPTQAPSAEPTATPSIKPTLKPTATPTRKPSTQPSMGPTNNPSVEPTPSPTNPTAIPTAAPSTNEPTAAPTQGVVCPENWDRFGHTCHLTSQFVLDGAACNAYCGDMGGQMLCIQDVQQNYVASQQASEFGRQLLTGWYLRPQMRMPRCGKAGGVAARRGTQGSCTTAQLLLGT